MGGRSERRHGYARGIYTFEESVALIKSLTTMESKVAHEIRYIAVRLYKASKAIDKQFARVVSEGPDDIKFFIQRSDQIFKKPYNISITDLGEIEDLYYATCAKVKALLKIVSIYIDEGFRAPNFEYFSYDSPGLRHLAPVEIWQFRAMLETHETALYSKRITEPLNVAVLEKNWCHLNRDATASITTELLLGGQGHDGIIGQGESLNEFDCSPQVPGLQDVRNKPCGLIFAELTEKYQSITVKEMTAKMEKEERRSLLRARAKEIGSDRNYPAPKVSVGDGERVDGCDSGERGDMLGHTGEKHPFGASNNPLAQLMLAGLATPDATMFARTLNTVETQLGMLEKTRLEEQGQTVKPSKLCRGSTSACTNIRQYKSGSADGLMPSSAGPDPFRYWQSAGPAGVQTEDLTPNIGKSREQRPLPGRKNIPMLSGSATPLISAGDGTTTAEGERSEVVEHHFGYVSRGTMFGAEAYGRRLYAGTQEAEEIKDGRKRASSEISCGSFKRIARSGP